MRFSVLTGVLFGFAGFMSAQSNGFVSLSPVTHVSEHWISGRFRPGHMVCQGSRHRLHR